MTNGSILAKTVIFELRPLGSYRSVRKAIVIRTKLNTRGHRGLSCLFLRILKRVVSGPYSTSWFFELASHAKYYFSMIIFNQYAFRSVRHRATCLTTVRPCAFRAHETVSAHPVWRRCCRFPFRGPEENDVFPSPSSTATRGIYTAVSLVSDSFPVRRTDRDAIRKILHNNMTIPTVRN